MKTLQEQYYLIKEGKGHKGIFLTEAKKQFPNMLTNPMGFEEASKILKTRGVISENYVDLKPITTMEATPKTVWENKFAQFLAEEAKIVEKKPTEEVEEIQSHGYNYQDKTNMDNQIGQEVLNGLYFEGRENPDKTLAELREMVAKNLAKDRQYYMKNAAFGVKGLGYQQMEVEEVAGKYAASGYSDKLKKMVKESLVKEEEGKDYTKLTSVGVETLKKVLQQVDKINIQVGPMSSTQVKNEADLLRVLMNELSFKQVSPGTYKLTGPNDSTVTMGKGSLDEVSDFEDPRAAAFRMAQIQKKMGTAPDQKVINKEKKLENTLKNAEYALFSLESDFDAEPELLRSFWGDWYQDQFDNIIDSIDSIKAKLANPKNNPLKENMEEMMDTNEMEAEPKEEVEPKPEKKKVKKESLESNLAEIDTQAGIVAMEAKLDKISEMISTKMERLSMIEEDTNLAELVDKVKVKEMQKEIKILEKYKSKMETMYEKMCGKKYTKEMVDETQIEESNTSDIEQKIKDGKIDPKKVQAAAEKAEKGDSTDLAMLMAFPK